MRAQVQVLGCAEWAGDVQDWLQAHFPHLNPAAYAGSPQLVVALDVPSEYLDAVAGWRGRLLEISTVFTLVLEIVEQALSEVGVPSNHVLSVHLQDRSQIAAAPVP